MDHRHRIEAAIRSVNELIIREKDPHRLLDEARRLLVENHGYSDAVLAVDRDGRITVFNPGAEKLFGCPADEALGSPITRFCPEERLEQQSEMMRRVRDTGAVAGYESERLTADGRRIPVEISLGLNTDDRGRTLGITAILRDVSERKQAEEALRTSEWLLRSTVDGLSAHIAVLDDRGEIILTNRAYRDFGERNGVDPSVVSEGANYLRVCDAASGRDSEAANLFADGIREVLSGKRQHFELEYPCDGPEGTLWFVGRVTPIQGEGPRRVVVAHESITARKQAEAAALASVHTLEDILESALSGYWDWNLVDNTEYLSPTFKRMFGYADHEMESSPEAWQRIILPEDLPGVLEVFDRHVKSHGREPFYNEVRYRHRDGSTVWVICAGRVIEWAADGTPVRVVGCHVDITERKHLEADRLKLFLLAESSSEFIGMCDLEMNPIYVNPAGQRMVGFPDMAAACRVKVQDYYFPEDQRFITDEFFPRVLREGHGDVEIRLRHFQTGEPIWVLYYLFSVHDASGTPVGWATVSRDITERKRADEEREKLQAQLTQAQKMEAVGRLAGGVAHDFNNMLGIIIGHADMLLEQMAADEPGHADIAEIRKAGARSADLTRQLLAFARKQIVAPKLIDLNKTVAGMTKMLKRLIGEDIDLAWIPGEKVWPVKIDPGQIDQILVNLCVNARDAIADVGKVTIETGSIDFDEDYCRLHAGFVPGTFVMMAVSDNGCGMDAETMSHLYEPFFTTKETGKGTGLGLATVYGVVKQNNGFINVYSELGQGTTFRVYLPRHLTKAVPLPEAEPDAPVERGHETVLLVEDEPAILRMTTTMLEREGYIVLGAGTPGEAIRLASEHIGDIHILMTDVVMPEMNGRDLAKNILSLYPHLKCLFMSGYTANVIAHHGVLDEGVNFIQKPFSKGDLTAKVREVLTRN